MACDSLKPALPALCWMANMHGLRNAGQLEQSTANRNAKHCAYVRQCPLLVSQSQSVTALITQAKMNSCQHVLKTLKTTTSATSMWWRQWRQWRSKMRQTWCSAKQELPGQFYFDKAWLAIIIHNSHHYAQFWRHLTPPKQQEPDFTKASASIAWGWRADACQVSRYGKSALSGSEAPTWYTLSSPRAKVATAHTMLANSCSKR